MTNTAVAENATSGQPSRRSFLGAGAVGAALVVWGARSVEAAAATGDEGLAAFAISAELAARDLYDAAIAAGADGTLWNVVREQHEAAAQLISARSGLSATGSNAALFDAMTGRMNSATRATAAELENTLAATHTQLLPMVASLDVVSALASIVVAEARQAAVLTSLAADDDLDDLDALLTNAATPLSPEA